MASRPPAGIPSDAARLRFLLRYSLFERYGLDRRQRTRGAPAKDDGSEDRVLERAADARRADNRAARAAVNADNTLHGRSDRVRQTEPRTSVFSVSRALDAAHAALPLR